MLYSLSPHMTFLGIKVHTKSLTGGICLIEKPSYKRIWECVLFCNRKGLFSLYNIYAIWLQCLCFLIYPNHTNKEKQNLIRNLIKLCMFYIVFFQKSCILGRKFRVLRNEGYSSWSLINKNKISNGLHLMNSFEENKHTD